MSKTALIYVFAALAEIAGCFSFWMWIREHRPAWWIVPGVASLVVFAGLLTQVDASAAGRVYAAYGGIYICISLVWLWGVEKVRPDHWDLIGAAACLVGAAVIILGPRAVR